MTLAELIQAAVHNQVFSGVMGGSLVMSVLYAVRGIPGRLVQYLVWQYTSEVMIFSDDPAFNIVSDWLASLEYAKKTRRLRLTAEYSEHEQGQVTSFSPGLGHHLFRHNGRFVMVHRTSTTKEAMSTGGRRQEDLTIRTFGSSPKAMHELIDQIANERRRATKTHIEVYIHRGWWRLACRKEKRSLDSIVLPTGEKEKLIRNIETFMASKSWYAERGVPYRHGILLYGPPGCGKTSLVLAVASHLSKRVYALNIGSMQNDDQLIDAISSVPESAMLLIEDIDAAQAKRAPTFEKAELPPGSAPAALGEKVQAQPITLSALLNAIDGVFSRDGRILFMTTNHPDKLDPALVRGGRADQELHVKELGAEDARTLCERFLGSNGQTEALMRQLKFPVAPAEIQKVLLASRSLN